MLLVESRTLRYYLDTHSRTRLLEKLQEKNLIPLIRSTRLHLYDLALLRAERAKELERAVSEGMASADDEPYLRGDLFCFEDFAHFLVFGEEADGKDGLRAGIIYEAETKEPQQKLDAFCRNVRDALEATRNAESAIGADALTLFNTEWQERAAQTSENFKRFASSGGSQGETMAPTAARGEMVAGWLRAVGMLEDSNARRVLRHLVEAHGEGRASALTGHETENIPESQLNKLSEVGLIKREILVSCRKDGRALFRLPSPDAFSVLTASKATCSECGAAVADEKAEEITVPTSLTSTLLQDGSWLTTHLQSILRNLGIPDRQIAAHPMAAGEGESRVMANVCGKLFLFLVRDGDWTVLQSRRAFDDLLQTGATHLVIVATGKVQDEARARLREYARRRAHGAADFEMIFVEGMENVASELGPAFARVGQRALAEELWELDANLGLSAGQLMASRFRLMPKPEAPKDLAASASALPGSSREF